MADTTNTAANPPQGICGDPARYDRGECNWPKCGCTIKDDAPTQTAELVVEVNPTGTPKPLQYGVRVGGRIIAILSPETVERAYLKFQDLAARRAVWERKMSVEPLN